MLVFQICKNMIILQGLPADWYWNSGLVRSCFLLFAHSRGSQEKLRLKTFSQISRNDDNDDADDDDEGSYDDDDNDNGDNDNDDADVFHSHGFQENPRLLVIYHRTIILIIIICLMIWMKMTMMMIGN